jgi:selenocysteine lyase/cysteine desulfurase
VEVNPSAQADYRLAREVRRLVADVYGAASPAVVLAPGTLAGLRLVFASLGVKRVTLSAGEYFDAASFPEARVDVVDAGDLLASIVRRRPDAVVLSAVTWMGERLPLEPLCRQIRGRLGAKAPLLVADFAHAGAAGFPKVTEVGADVVVGDVTKWITPPSWPDKLGYLWFRSADHRALAQRLFAAFYLALARPTSALESRWVDPGAALKVAAFRRRTKVTRRRLLARYAADLALAKRMAGWCGVAEPSSPLLWIQSRAGIAKIPTWAKDLGLLWRPPSGGARAMCRSDLAP